MNSLPIHLLLISLFQATAFAPPKPHTSISTAPLRTPTHLQAKLSPRQLQFWQDVQSGLYTIEVGAGTGTPTITLYGKLISSSDPEVDSGWIELAQSASTTPGTISGGSVNMYPYMSAAVTGNSGAVDIQVTIAYSNRGI